MTDPTNKDIAEALRSITDLPLGASLILRLAADRLDPPTATDPDDGWIKWDGGEKPDLFDDTLVSVRFRDGDEDHEEDVAYWKDATGDLENNWVHDGSSLDIVAYRVIE